MARTAAIGIKIEPALKEAVEKAAADDGRSMAQWVERLIIRALREQGYLPKPQ